MSQAHPTDEQLSAALDGEDPGAARHAEGCPTCQARLDDLRSVMALLATPLPADELARERAVAAALAAPVDAVQAVDEPRRRGVGAGSALGVVAALVVIVLGVGIFAGRKSPSHQTASRQSKSADSSAELSSAAVNGGDLGDLSDPQALRARVDPALNATGDSAGGGTAGAGASSSAGSAAKAENQAAASTTTFAPVAGAPAPAFASGPPPCTATVAKEYAGGNGALVYFASVRWAGKPAVVLAYNASQPSTRLRHRLYVLARADCALLAYVSS